LAASISDIRINGFDPTSVTVYTGLNPTFSWSFIEDVESTTQTGFIFRVGSSNTGLGTDNFVGSSLNIEVTSSVPYYEYPNHNLSRSMIYYGQVKAWDNEYSGSGEGAHVSDWLTFQFNVNTLPSATSVAITPASATVADDLSIGYIYNDDDGHDESGTVIRWYKDNVLQADLNDLVTIENRYLAIGDSWSASVTPFDGLEYGATVRSQAVTIATAQINISNIQILPTDANIDDYLQVEYTVTDDPYMVLTNSTTTFAWYINGTQVSDNTQIVRLDLSANDQVYARVIIQNNGNTVAEGMSPTITIADVPWILSDLKVGGYLEPVGLTELNPLIEWKKHKTKAASTALPAYLRVLITKTPSRSANYVFDSGYIDYTKDSYLFSTDVLERGKCYFIHVGAGDTQTFTDYITSEVIMAGSSWGDNVDNAVGWTIEFKAKLGSDGAGARQGVYIHDGTYFGSMIFSIDNVDDAGETKIASIITFVSDAKETYEIIEPAFDESFAVMQTYRITGMGRQIKIFLNNKKVLELPTGLSSTSLLKRIEFGDIEAREQKVGTWKFVRYSTDGPYDIDAPLLADTDAFDFYEVGDLPNGSIDAMIDDAFFAPTDYAADFPSSFIVSWTPTTGSSQLFGFNENAEEYTLPVATINYAPITKIRLDKDKNRYLATANGVIILYGSKHDPDYEFDTDGDFTISPSDFDLITNIPASVIDEVSPSTSDYIEIDTSSIILGVETQPEWNEQGDFDPYYNKISRGIFYYSQRTHGQAWFDYVDNEKGWQVEFTLNVGLIEQDETSDTDTNKEGVGVYVNDGVHQEFIIFTRSAITFLFANVTISLNTGYRRTYRIVGKGDDIRLYQRYSIMSAGTESLALDGTGLFTTAATIAGNSRYPRMAIDSDGNYHAVWHSDGKRTSDILYSKNDGSSWSHPEVIVESAPFSIKNPDIALDSNDTIYVVYEDLSYGQPEISCSIKDVVGWNPKIRVTNHASLKSGARLAIDHNDNVHVVWEDHRNGTPEIYWCYRNKQYEAWQSSAQFTQDENIISQNAEDSEMGSNAMSFRNPAVCYAYPKIYVAFEANYGDGTTAIFISRYDVLAGTWVSSGYPMYDSDGNATIGTSTRVSDTGRVCVHPDISGFGSLVAMAWEDQTEPISQIWGNSLFVTTDTEFTGATKITSRTSDCKNPSVGFVSSNPTVVVLFESQELAVPSTGTAGADDDGAVATWSDETSPNADTGQIFAVTLSVGSGIWRGSATGYTDELIFIETEKTAKHPHLPKVLPTEGFVIVYDYYKNLSSSPEVTDTEHPGFWMIGDADVFVDITLLAVSVDTRGIGTTSSLYTKEFAFGDIDDAIGVQLWMRDIDMYFGYDARPLSSLELNTTTVADWPDNRVYDLYPDIYGNVLACTYSGLVYYNISTNTAQMIELETGVTNLIVTAIDYLRNGLWFIGTKEGKGTSPGTYYSYDGGQNWHKATYGVSNGDDDNDNGNGNGNGATGIDITNVNSITADVDGNAVIGTINGIYRMGFDFEQMVNNAPIHNDELTKHITNLTAPDATTDDDVKVVKVDASNVIWAGTESGIVRIENEINKSVANIRNGMRSSHVTDIAIIDRGTRYVATVTGIEKMTGFSFEHINSLNYDITSDNVLSINFQPETNSLWFSSNKKLYELVFRDPQRDAIANELVEYDTEIDMTASADTITHYILDIDTIVGNSSTFELTSDATTVLINKNPIDFGYSIDTYLQAVVFEVEPLDTDQVDVVVSNKFKIFKDFTQTNIEQSVIGQRDTSIIKFAMTSQNQLFALAGNENPALMAYVGLSNLPFALVTLDREKPVGCLTPVEQLGRSTYKFKITAVDQISGVTDMIVSNYSNFTSDGTTEQDWQDLSTYTIHDIGDQLNQITTEFTFPSTVEINATTYNVGTGRLLATVTPAGQAAGDVKTYVYAITTKPVVIFRLNPSTEEWEAIATLDEANTNLEAHSSLVVGETLFITTGVVGGTGTVYKTVNGREYTVVGSGGNHIYCGVATDDGYVYFGSNEGIIYEYAMSYGGTFSVAYRNIGESVLGLEYASPILYAATENTGNQGPGFQIDVTTGDVLTFFPRASTKLSDIQILNENMFVVVGDRYEIWRSDYHSGEQLNFVKSYSTSLTTTMDLYAVPNAVLDETLEVTT